MLADPESSLARLATSRTHGGDGSVDSLVPPTLHPQPCPLPPLQQAGHLPEGNADCLSQQLCCWLERGHQRLPRLKRAAWGLPRFPARCQTNLLPTCAHLHFSACNTGGGGFTHPTLCLSLSQSGLRSALHEGFSKISGFILSPHRVYLGCLSPKNFIWSLLLLCFHLFPEDLHSSHPPFYCLILPFNYLISYSLITACAFSQDCGFLIITTRPDHHLS